MVPQPPLEPSEASAEAIRPDDRRLTRSARGALYGSFALTAICTLVLVSALSRRVHIEIDDTDYAALQTVIDLQGLVRIDTTSDRGNEAAAAHYLAEMLAREGIDSEVEEFEGGRANLVAVLEGRKPELLVLHSHLDTDPISRPELWREEPFGGDIRGPYLYGRGVFDMKSVTIAQVHAMLAAARRARELGPALRSVALLATSSEETDSELGTQHILAERQELVDRMWAVLTEGGIVEATDWDAIKHWGVSFVQKGYAPVNYRSRDRAALEELRRQLREGELGTRYGSPRPVPEAEIFLADYLETRQNPEIREPLRDLEALLADPEAFERQPPFIKALFRNELHTFDVRSAGLAHETDLWELPILLHLPPGTELEDAVAELLPPEEQTAEFERTVSPPPGSSQASPLDHPVFETLLDQIAAAHGDVPRGPFYLAFYANDCRFFRAADVPCYGFSPFLLPGSDSVTTAGPDERISLRGFVGGVELYETLVEKLLESPTESDS